MAKAESKELAAAFDEGQSKPGAEGKATTPSVEVRRIDITPESAPLNDGLELELEYEVDGQLIDASWEIKVEPPPELPLSPSPTFLTNTPHRSDARFAPPQFMVDSAHKRHIILLGTTDAEPLVSGLGSFYFMVPQIDVTDVKPGTLTNCGLLTASLTSDGMPVLDVNMVVVVTQEACGLVRTIYSPLDS
mmetsp:Transcript_73490/g.209102  ORF Transcript_73490/g.209102 Transcript_73490/m.209102 type:complete len:190 (+) Transcript_73490:1847-2416(+)